MENITPFHVAIPVHNLAECRKFYRDVLECEEGRSSDQWVDFNHCCIKLTKGFITTNNCMCSS